MVKIGELYPRDLLLSVVQGAQALADREGRKHVVRRMAHTSLVYVALAGEVQPVDSLITAIEPCPKGHTRVWQLGPDGHPYSNAARI